MIVALSFLPFSYGEINPPPESLRGDVPDVTNSVVLRNKGTAACLLMAIQSSQLFN